jgi:hypothetical protein
VILKIVLNASYDKNTVENKPVTEKGKLEQNSDASIGTVGGGQSKQKLYVYFSLHQCIMQI